MNPALQQLGRISRDILLLGVGEHEPIVDAATFARVQERLAGKVSVPTKLADRPEFPLRGFALCDHCGKPLTASWSRGKLGGRYGYYFCWNAACKAVRLTLTGLESAFEALLERMQLEEGDFDLVAAELAEICRADESELATTRAAAGRRLLDLRKRRDRMVEAFVYDQAVDRATYEAHLQRLDGEIQNVNLELSRTSGERLSFDQLLERAKPMLTGTRDLWRHAELHEKRRLQALLFPEGIRCTSSQLRTPAKAEIYCFQRGSDVEKVRMVERMRAGSNPLLAWIEQAGAVVEAVLGRERAAWGTA